jgi:hypothetical protein
MPTYQVKILDLKYLSDFEHLCFKHITYEVCANHRNEAITVARKYYMEGKEGVFVEELPFVLKLFSVNQPTKPE